MGWIIDGTDERLAALWPGAVQDYEPDDEGLAVLLASAATWCAARAPQLAEGLDVPPHYVHAQALKARQLALAGQASPSDQIGGYGDQTPAAFATDYQIVTILRPKTRPVVA